MFNYEYKSTTTAGRVCLELSLKPFGYDKSVQGIEKVCTKLFEEWKPLLKHASGCAILLWTSDGSEILEFSGNLDDSFEWCKYIGIGNWDRNVPKEEANKNKSLHAFPVHYIENPPDMTYGDLKNIIEALKRVGKKITGHDIKVGETFDPGPEFAYSEFKFERHTEIAVGDTMGLKQWLHCTARLHAEDRKYAAYPNGIPEGTHIGEFLGRQFMAMKNALGFDYIWLSNGFGFSLSSWSYRGELFDGKKFDFSGAAKVRANISEFWKYFTAEIGDTVIETRGSNMSTGMDISAHGCPIDEIYRQNIIAPPNSPWAAMDYRFGLELVGYMSHIAEIPVNGYSFRYYSHDPWWLNSPWFDRYDRSPHDIYLPLSIARLDENLKVTKPSALDLLTADDSFGRIPTRGANEMTPHFLTAFNDFSDKAGLVTWVYPFDAYCKIGLYDGNMQRIFMDDWFVESSIDQGFPVNTVISDKNFIKADKSKLLDTILLTPVPEADSDLEKAVFEALALGARVILFGSTKYASQKLREAVGVALAENTLEGTLKISTSLPLDKAETGEYSNTLLHDSLVSDGGIYEIADSDVKVLATVTDEKESRVYATYNEKMGKGLYWIRGSFPHENVMTGHLPMLRKKSEFFVPSVLLRAGLSLFGYTMTFNIYNVNDSLPIVMLPKTEEAVYFTTFSKDATIKLNMSTPDGAIAPDNCEFFVENNMGTYNMPRWQHTDCRIYIKQEEKSKISVKKDNPATHVNTDERIDINGLKNATVTFYPPEGGTAFMQNYSSDIGVWEVQPHRGPKIKAEYNSEKGCYTVENVTGKLVIMWQRKENIGDYEHLEFLR